MKDISLKVSATLLAILLAVSLAPASILRAPASAAEQDSGVQKIVDPDTSGSWRSLFDIQEKTNDEPAYSTKDAGRIWADKSVYESNEAARSSGIPGVSMIDPENDFLVGLSTISASSTTRSESPYAHDVVFVVSLNSSMAGLNYDGKPYLAHIADALNQSIDRLMKENEGAGTAKGTTRVAVIGYSVDVTVLMPLDSYSPNDKGQYIVFSNSAETGAGLDPVCTPDAQGTQTKSEVVRGSAYLQKALATSSDILEQAALDASPTQPRKPELVIMGASVPLMASSNISDPPDYLTETVEEDGFMGSMPANHNAVGFGTDAAFATLLTLQEKRAGIDEAYDANNGIEADEHDDLGIWTVGLDTSGMAAYVLQTASWQARASISEKVNGQTVDLAENIRSAQKAYGLAAETGLAEVSLDLYGTDTGGIIAETVPFAPAKGLLTSSNGYAFDGATEYFHATDAGAIPGGFNAAVNRILGIDYNSPVNEGEGSVSDSSDRLRMQDDIGHLMNVKKIDGVLYRNRLLDGSKAAQAVTASFHDPWDVESYHEVQCIMDSLNKRYDLGWDAYTLLYDAFVDGQFAYRGASDYSNFVAWYVNQDHETISSSGSPYIFASTQEVEAVSSGRWEDQASADTKEKIEKAQADGATALCQTYFYIGNIEGQYAGDDVPLYDFVVMVETNLESGDQKVLLTIPADSVPSRKAYVTVHLDGTTTMSLDPDAEQTFPLRVVYEVGPREDVSELAERIASGEEVSESEIERTLGQDVLRNASGRYLLCTNAFEGKGDSAQAQTVMSAVAASTNAYYSFTEDTPLYALKAQAALPEGSSPSPDQVEPLKTQPVAGETYYYLDTYYEADGLEYGTEAPAVAVAAYEPYTIADDGSFDPANYLQSADGQYFARSGTPKHVVAAMLENYEKDPNATSTAPYIKQLSVSDYSSLGAPMITARLGNNGVYAMGASQKTGSLTVSKSLAQESENNPVLSSDKERAFSFEVSLEDQDGSPLEGSVSIVGNGGSADREIVEIDDGTIDIELSDGQSATIEDLPANTTYQIRELSDASSKGLFKPSYRIVENGSQASAGESDSTGKQTLAEGSTEVQFENAKQGGSIIVTKETAGNAADPSQSFTFDISLKDEEGKPLQGEFAYGLFDGSDPSDWDAWSLGTATTNENGSLVLEDGDLPALANGRSIAIAGIPEGASYAIGEKDADGYTMTVSNKTVGAEQSSSNPTGSIKTSGQTDVVTFTNEKWSYGSLVVTKRVAGSQNGDESFTFEIKLTDAAGDPLSGTVQYRKTGADGIPSSTGEETLRSDGTFDIEIENGQSVAIENLAQGTRYLATEKDSKGYLVLSDGSEGTIGPNPSYASFTNVGKTASLAIAKTITGNASDKTMECSFEVTVKGMFASGETEKRVSASKYSSNGDVEKTKVSFYPAETGSDGVATVSGIGDGEGVLIDDIDAGSEFSVKEIGAEDLASQGYTISSGIGEASATASTVSGTVGEGDTTTVFFENAKSEFGSLAIEKRIKGNAAEDEAELGRTFEFAITASKDGSPLVGSFSATLSDKTEKDVLFENGTASVTLSAPASSAEASTITINGLPVGTTCFVSEQDMSDSGYVESKDPDQSVAIAAGSTATVRFLNQKSYEPFDMPITGLEVLDGKSQKAGDFVFQLYEADGTVPVLGEDGKPVTAKSRAAEPGVATTFVLKGLRITEPGEHTYVVRQIGGTQEPISGVSYDQRSFVVNVGASASATGKLRLSSLSYDVGSDPTFGIMFVNRYETSSAEFSLNVKKTLDGSAPQDGRFSFSAQEVDPVTETPVGAPLIASNGASGIASFPSVSVTVPAGETVVRTFIIREIMPQDANEDNGFASGGVLYDGTRYLATVTATDADGDGAAEVQAKVAKAEADSGSDGWEPLSGTGVLSTDEVLPTFANVNEKQPSPPDSDEGGDDDPIKPDDPEDSDDPGNSDNPGDSEDPEDDSTNAPSGESDGSKDEGNAQESPNQDKGQTGPSQQQGNASTPAQTGDGAAIIATATLVIAILAGCAIVLSITIGKQGPSQRK